MHKPRHLSSAADAAHALALEIHRFSARWPEDEREGLTLEIRRAARELSSRLTEANERLRGRALRRAVDDASGKHAKVGYLLRFATDLGFRKLSPSGKVDDLMAHLETDLDLVSWEAREDDGLDMVGAFRVFRPTPASRQSAGTAAGNQHPARRRKRYS